VASPSLRLFFTTALETDRMKTTKLAVLTACALLTTPLAWAECSYPQKPAQLPDGNTATLEDMIAGQKSVRQFDADVTAFTKCLDEAAAAELADPNLTEEQKKQIKARQAQQNNAAVDEVSDLAARFNEQLRAYKARQPK
jgi:hypothetical protein